MANTPQKTPLLFYRSSAGNEPVREWLKELDDADRWAMGQDAGEVALAGWHAALPSDEARLWEIRTTLPSRRIGRVLLCVDEGALIALHAFIKKTQKTPDAELALARKRQKELTT